jgi:hypothetical protein
MKASALLMRILLGTVIGGGTGFLLGYFGKCQSGVCPLTSNPYISTVIGIIIGIALALSWGK